VVDILYSLARITLVSTRLFTTGMGQSVFGNRFEGVFDYHWPPFYVLLVGLCVFVCVDSVIRSCVCLKCVKCY
jgi:hypothetical protein